MKSKYLSLLPLIFILLFVPYDVVAKENWNRVQTKNFTVVGDASQGDMKKIALKLEEFRATLAEIFPRAKINTPVPTTVVLFKTDDSFRRYKPRYKGKIKDNVAGYFMPGKMMNFIVLSADKTVGDPYEVIFHEFGHFLLDNNVSNVPPWLSEGLAEFYSTFDSNGDREVKIGTPIEQHIYVLRNEVPLPLKTLLEVDRKSPHYNESRKAGAFYAGSWALFHYLMIGDGAKRQPQLIRFMSLVDSGAPLDTSFQKAFGITPKMMEDELMGYVRKYLFPVLLVKFRDPIVVDKDVESRPLADAEAFHIQGSLLSNLAQFDDAKTSVNKSLALDPNYSPALVESGRLAAREQNFDDAEKRFIAAVSADPKNFLAHYYRAEMFAFRGKYLEAIESYKQAIALKPDLAMLYSDLGYAYSNAGNNQEAVKSFESGLAANPREANFYRSLGYAYLDVGKPEYAAGSFYNFLARKGFRDDGSQYIVLGWYFALRMMKNHAFAAKNLNESVPRLDATEWPYPVLQYLTKTLPLADLLAQAKDNNDKLTEVHAYAGLELSLNGEREAALEHLRWVKANGNKRFVEYPMALNELAKLESATPDK